MRSSTLSLVAVSTAVASVAAQNSTDPVGCANGLYILVARGSTEEPGPGVYGAVADDIADQIPGAIVGALDWPATFDNYDDSVTEGVVAMRSALVDYHANCPDGKIALMGYSQGAHVITLSLCEGSEVTVLTQNHTIGNPLRDEIVDKIIAIANIGDPSHTVEETYNDGTSENDGLFPLETTALDTCNALADRFGSWCDTGDRYCDRGNDTEVHHSYIDKYGPDIVEFVVNLYEDSDNPSGGNSTATFSPTPTPTAAPTDTTGGQVSETSNPEDAAAWLEPGRGLLYVAPLAVMALSQML